MTATNQEVTIRTEVVRLSDIRRDYGDLDELRKSMLVDGLRHPITVWTDCTLVSGSRRLRAQLLNGRDEIKAVFVDNIEDAAARLTIDNADETAAKPMAWSEICRLWELLRILDEPNAVRRADAARRRGVALRKQTQSGARPAGRARSRTENYLLAVASKPFGIGEASASRAMTLYRWANDLDRTPEERERATRLLSDLDEGRGSIWSNFAKLTGQQAIPTKKPKQQHNGPSLPPNEQIAAWNRSLPVLEGLIDGLLRLGPPHEDLDWNQLGPVSNRLSAARRELEKIIRKMKEQNPT